MAPPIPAPLDITCSSSACVLGRHYYGPKRRRRSVYPVGECCDCGVRLVDWDRVHRQAVNDVDYTMSMLRTECWRHEWWHREFDERALNHAYRKGRADLRLAAASRVATSVGREASFFDSRQTPKKGNVLYYAQHATGTCCRQCIQYWHGIPPDRPLTTTEQSYCIELIMRYLAIRMTDLPEEGQYVPRCTRSGNDR